MGAFKEIAIVEQRDADVAIGYHDWQFIEHRADSLSAKIARSDALADYASSYARTLHSGDEAIDVIEKPHHYVEEIALHISDYFDGAAVIVSQFGYWECASCDAQSETMTLTIDHDRSCREEN